MAGEESLAFEGVLPPIAVAALAAALVGTAAWTLRRAGLPAWARAAMLSLRAVAAGAIAVALLGPSMLSRDEVVIRPRAMLLLDASQSMALRDRKGGATRRKDAIDRLALAGLAETHDVSRFDFGAALREAVEWDPAAEDPVTAAGDAIPEAVRRLKGRPGGSVVVISDGRTTSGSDPVRAAAGARERGVVVHTVGVGESAPVKLRDRKVALIACPGVAQVQAQIPIQGYVTVRGEQGGAVRVTLKVDDAVVETKELVADEDRYSTRVPFLYKPEQVGEKRVTVEIETGEGEFDAKNNSMSTFVRVVHKDLRILCLEGKLAWEMTFLRRVLSQIPDAHVETRSLFGSETPDPAILDKMNVILIGDVTAERLGAEFLMALERHVREREAGLIFLAGSENLAEAESWTGTPMEALLPFGLAGTEAPSEASLAVQPTSSGSDHFILMLDKTPERSVAAWRRMPKLEAVAKIGVPKPAASILAQGDDRPLLVAQPYGRGRTLAFLGEMSWKWALEADETAEKYGRFWRQCVLWAARKEKSARRLSVDLPRYLFLAGDPIDMTVAVENPPGTPVDDAAVQLAIEGPGGAAPAPVPAWFGGAYRSALSFTEPGDYRVTVTARRGDDDFGRATARFTVISPSAELDQPAPDLEGLMATAAAGGGIYRPLTAIHEVIDRLQSDSRPVRVERIRRRTLWDRPWLILLFAAALGGEWILRRRFGLA